MKKEKRDGKKRKYEFVVSVCKYGETIKGEEQREIDTERESER